MPQVIKNLFKNLKEFEPPEKLQGRILSAVAAKKAQAMKRKLFFVQSGITVSLGVLLGSLLVFGKSFLDSDFVNLVKLMFSDTGMIMSHMGNFSISLLENMPVFEIFAMLVPIFILTVILSWYYKFENNNFKHA